MAILRRYTEDNFEITEYTKDGTTVSSKIKQVVSDPLTLTEVDKKPSLEEIAESTLIETQYQTVLIELLAGF